MVIKTSYPGLAGKTRGTRFLATLTILILCSLAYSGGKATAAVTWQAQGPSPFYNGDVVIVPNNPVTGAIQSLLIDPSNNNNMYIGAVNGGIWKTTDGGTNWTPLIDTLKSLSMGGMAMDPNNSSVILAGFGAFSNADGNHGPRAGVILSSDAGATWTPVGGAVTTSTDVSSVLVNGQNMFVASRAQGSDVINTGLFRSTDGGASFIKISGSGGLPTGAITSLASDPSNANIIYAAVTNAGIFRSDNLGQTWTNITPPGSGVGTLTGNIQLSVGAGGQSLFVAVANSDDQRRTTTLYSVWRTLDQGATWQNMGGKGSGPGQGLPGTIENGAFVGINKQGQANNNLALRADPNNPNIVYVSGDATPPWNFVNSSTTRGPFPNQIGATLESASIFRGDASLPPGNPPAVDNWLPATPSQAQWFPITDNFAASGTTPHADSRSMVFDASGNLLETNDGGIYRRTMPQSSNGVWTSLIGNLQVTEMYSVIYDNNTHTIFAGNQDNGSGAQQTSAGGTPVSTWMAQLGGDGGNTAVNDSNPNFSVRYMSEQRLGNFTRVEVDPNNNVIETVPTNLKVKEADGTIVSFDDYENSHNSSSPNQAPLRVNPDNMSMLAIGTQIVYLATDNVSGTLSQDLVLTPINAVAFDSPVGDLAYGRPGNANLLLAAEGANLHLSTTLQPDSFTKLNYPGSNTITGVFINPNSDTTFYVADGTTFRSTSNAGTNWFTGPSFYQLRSLQFISQNSVNEVVVGGYGTLYAARDTDLYNWYSLKGNLPNTFVWYMDYSKQDDTLVVGTLGRGAFSVTKASTLMPATTPTSVDAGWLRLLNAGSGDQTLNGGTVQNPDSATLPFNFTLTTQGGTFDTSVANPTTQTISTITGVISGPGSLTVTGTSNLSLQNNNKYEGGTILNGGTVMVTSDANLGAASGGLTFGGGTLQTGAAFTSARSITLMPDGGTWDTNGFTSTLSGVISGSGTFSKDGDGILTLTGINTYSGGTLLNGGILKVSRDANLGAAAGPVSFSGGTLQAAGALTSSRTLVVQGSGAFDTGTYASVFNGELFGYGTFTQKGSGSLTLNGDGSPFVGTYTVSSGAFTLNNALGSPLAPCSLVINPGSTWTGSGSLVGSLNLQGDGSGFTGSVVVPVASTLSGNGALSGSLNLLGNGAGFGGTYTVTQGTFSLDNTLGGTPAPANVLINPGALMTGSGTLVGTLTNRGTISPGHSPGTLSVVGSYTQTANGTYIAEIASPGSYDRIAVSGAPGTASLAGTLSPVLLSGYRLQGNTVFPGVVTATGGISGTFSSVTNQMLSPTLFWQPRYSANSVDLLVQRDYTNPGLSLNSNQLAVGTMLNSVAGATSGDLNNVLNAVDSLPNAATVQEAYKQISPEKAGALANLGFAAANFQVRNLATRTTNLRFVQGANGGAGCLAPGGLNCSYSRQSGVMLAYNGGFIPDLFSARREFQAPESRWGIFADGGAAFGTQSSTSNQTGYSFTLGGFTLGADYRLTDHLLVGLATGYSNTASSFCGTGGSVTVNTVPFNAYAAYFSGPLYAYGSLGYALNLYNLRRAINFDGIGRTATSSTTGNQLNLYGETGYDLKLRQFILTPATTLTYSALWLGGFSEQAAGALNLRVRPQNASSVQTGLGGRVTLPLKMGRMLLASQAYAFYQHEFANGSRGLNASLSQGSSSFSWQTDAAGQNFALVGASLTAGLRDNLYAQVNFNSEVGRCNATAQFINAGLRYEF